MFPLQYTQFSLKSWRVIMEICVQRRSAIGDPRKMPKPIVAVGTVPQRLINKMDKSHKKPKLQERIRQGTSGEVSVVWVVMQTSAEGVRHLRGVRGGNFWNIDPRNAICDNLSIIFQKIAWSNDGKRCGYFGIFQTTIMKIDTKIGNLWFAVPLIIVIPAIVHFFSIRKYTCMFCIIIVCIDYLIFNWLLWYAIPL
jgi:hypothetical protein